MQTINTTETMNPACLLAPNARSRDAFCQIDIFADEDLFFNVRVICGRMRFVAGGFMNPDEAQRKGMAAMLAMHRPGE